MMQFWEIFTKRVTYLRIIKHTVLRYQTHVLFACRERILLDNSDTYYLSNIGLIGAVRPCYKLFWNPFGSHYWATWISEWLNFPLAAMESLEPLSQNLIPQISIMCCDCFLDVLTVGLDPDYPQMHHVSTTPFLEWKEQSQRYWILLPDEGFLFCLKQQKWYSLLLKTDLFNGFLPKLPHPYGN